MLKILHIWKNNVIYLLCINGREWSAVDRQTDYLVHYATLVPKYYICELPLHCQLHGFHEPLTMEFSLVSLMGTAAGLNEPSVAKRHNQS